jgi:hypothetical protein
MRPPVPAGALTVHREGLPACAHAVIKLGGNQGAALTAGRAAKACFVAPSLLTAAVGNRLPPPRKWGHRSSNEQRPRDVRLRIERHIRENAQDSPRAPSGAYFFAIHASPASSTRKPTLPRHRRGRGKACAGVRSVQNAVRTLLPPGCGPRRSSFTVATVEQPLQGQPSPPQIRQISCGPLGLSDCSQTDCRRHHSRISPTTRRRWRPF